MTSNVVRAAMAGPCPSCSVGQSRHSADRCWAYWWAGLMLRAAVTAVRGVSFKPIHPLSGVYVGVILFLHPFHRQVHFLLFLLLFLFLCLPFSSASSCFSLPYPLCLLVLLAADHFLRTSCSEPWAERGGRKRGKCEPAGRLVTPIDRIWIECL